MPQESNKTIIIGSILFVVFIAGAGFLVFYFRSRQSAPLKKEQTVNSPGSVTKTAPAVSTSFIARNFPRELLIPAASSGDGAAARGEEAKNLPEPSSATSTNACPILQKTYIVKGTSLEGIIKPGEKVTVMNGYYACREVARNDIVIYKYAGSGEDLIIKIAKGIPGDAFHFKKTASGYTILINNKTLVNSAGVAYKLDDPAYKLLSLYEKDYKGIVPPQAYLIMGDVSSGSLDSTRFGLVGKSDITGKVIRK